MGVLPPDMPPSLRPKLCVDCRYYVDEWIEGQCSHPEIELACLAKGRRQDAWFVRKYGACGREGKFFEAAPPKLSRVTWWTRLQWRLWRWVRS